MRTPLLRSALAALMLLAPATHAADDAWSVGIGFGQAAIGTAEYGDGKAIVTTLEVGWQATDALRVFGGYANHDNNGGFTNCINPFCGAPPFAVYNDSGTLFLGAEGQLPLGGAWTGLARLTYRTIDPRPYYGSDTSAISLGLGAEYAFSSRWAARVTVESYDVDSTDYLETTIGVRYRFAGAELADAVAEDGRDARWQLSVGVASNELTGVDNASFTLAGTTTGYQLGGALRAFGPFWIEVGYQDLGRFEGRTVLIDISGGFPPAEYPTSFAQDGTALTYGLRVEQRIGAGFSGLARAGRIEGSLDRHYGAAGPYPARSISLDESASTLGLGVAYAFDERWSLELAYDDVDVEDVPGYYFFSALPDTRWSLALRASF